MAKMNKEKRDRLILVCICTLAVMTGLWMLLVRTQEEKLTQMAAEIGALEEQIESTRRLVAQRSEFEHTLQKMQEELAVREDGMANGDHYFWFVNMLNKFKADYAVDIPQISPAIAGPVGIFPKYPYEAATFKVGGSGHFYDFGRFLRDFENEHPYIRVQNLMLEPLGGANSNSEKVSFQMDVVTLIKAATPQNPS